MDEEGVEWITLSAREVHMIGAYDDKHELFLRLPPVEFPIQGVELRFEWKDQGWGNRKGQLLLKRMREGAELSSHVIEPHPAAHIWTSVRFAGSVSDGDMACCVGEPGDVFEVWRYVGGGGGHELYIRDFKMRLIPEVCSLK